MAGFGETLRQARAHKNVTLREAEAETRINRHHLAALEEEQLGAMPPAIYSRGIVRKYADYLGLDAGKMLDMHRELTGDAYDPAPINATPAELPRMWAPNFAIMAFGVVLTAIVFAWGYSLWLSPTADGDISPSTSIETPAATQSASSARPTPPAVPTAQTTAEPVAVTGGDNQNNVVPTQQIEASVYRTGIGITVTADAQITVTVDGQVVFDDVLQAGMSTDMFVGTDFTITTSDASVSYFFNSCGTTAGEPMDTAGGEMTTSFSAHDRSCAPPEG